ncbi:MAG: hypothetical protein ACRCWB_03730 [Enterovibrio sp.]
MAKKALVISLLVSASAAQTGEMHQHQHIPPLPSAVAPDYNEVSLPYFGEEGEKNKEARVSALPMAVQQQMAQALGATLVNKKALTPAPRVLGSQNKLQFIDKSMTFFVDAQLSQEPWAVYRPMATFKRAVGKKEIEMVSLEYVAMAKVLQHDGKMTQMALQSQYQEVRPNDILLRPYLLKKYTSRSTNALELCAKGAIEGQINGRRYAGLDELVVVNLGLRDGLHQGYSLNAIAKQVDVNGRRATQFGENDDASYEYKKWHQDASYTLSKQAIGELNIVQVFPYFSLAKVKTAQQPISVGTAVELCRE